MLEPLAIKRSAKRRILSTTEIERAELSVITSSSAYDH